MRWLALSILLSGPSLALAADPPAAAPDYAREVRPLLSRHCFACHGQDEGTRAKDLRLDRRADATRTLDDGATAIVPGDPDASDLLFRVTEEDETIRMPPKKAGERLTDAEIGVLRRWIAAGAPYAEHWAFTPPQEHPLPDVPDPARARNPIDRWVQARLQREALDPSPEADRAVLLRRVTLDLTGLPPTPDEIDAFLADSSPTAYEKAVDRLLASPAYGERWARMWLDLARYADSAGYGSDPLRPDMYRYRDWVIDALNRNLPFDRFTVEQIAGDLLPDADDAQRIATAFHRNTMTNTEGGTDDEEWRTAAVKDRADTTMQVWMGLTFGCARCHSHKYDPISHQDYYSLYAIFNQTADTDQPDERPTLPAPTPEMLERTRRIDQQLAALKQQLETPTPELVEAQARWEAERTGEVAWTPLAPLAARTDSGATLTAQDDGSLLATGDNPPQDTYTLTARLGAPGPITALRLEALPDPALPGGGPGRADNGNFVLTRLSVESAPDDDAPATPVGRFVRIELPGAGKMLSVAEVQVESGGRNVAPDGEARQSSTAFEGDARRAIDGNTRGDYFEAHSVTHTRPEQDPWWEVKLPAAVPIDRITLWNRTDHGHGIRLAGAELMVLDDDRHVVWRSQLHEPPDPSRTLEPSGRRALPLSRAVADFAQDGFPVADAIKPAMGQGWAVAPRTGQPHSATFLVNEPGPTPGPRRLVVRLEFRSPHAGHNLGRFRLSVTDDPRMARRADVPEPILAVLDVPAESRTPDQTAALAKHFRSITPELQPIREQIAALETSRPAIPKLPVMVELPPDQRRKTRILNKGNFLDPGAEVEPAVPAAFHPFPPDAPEDRLGLARWLIDPQNPLTARVAVNRLWAQLFGTGLVETEEDFGTQGDPPSHPELLDWLALTSMRNGWDTKALLRTIVTSATYRQSSRVTPELLEKDPRNRLLGRAPRYRLEAETVRDQALAVSGLLSRKLGGPSVFPPQPEGLWQAAFNGQRTWATSPGADRHRRGLYTFWRRTIPYPSMATFDAPSREICAVRRVRTNTPLQAFVTLNDPVYVEAAQALARRLVAEGGTSPDERIAFGLKLALGRPASPEQVAPLAELYRSELARYQSDREAARALATDPLGPLPEGADPADLAAWTTVANVLLNLDGVLTRN